VFTFSAFGRQRLIDDRIQIGGDQKDANVAAHSTGFEGLLDEEGQGCFVDDRAVGPVLVQHRVVVVLSQ
jgi:hypothetical protein